MNLAKTPEPPYYACIFTSLKPNEDPAYTAMANRMLTLAAEQAGFLGVESARGEDGLGITVSYWQSREAMQAWKADAEHQLAQAFGKSRWYRDYQVRIARVERDYGPD